MTSNSRVQHLLHLSQQASKRTGWAVAIGIVLLGVLLSAPAQAAVFTVNSPADPPAGDATPGNGACETAPGNGVCTLRAAIQEANALAGADQIILPPNTYLLTIVTELTITTNLTITGGGASTTIIDGNRILRPNSGVLSTSSGVTVNLSGITIRNGRRTAGGGILNEGTLTLINSTVSGNSAGPGSGGGIRNSFGTLTLINSTVSGNFANFGGGIDIFGTVTLTNSTVSGNSAGLDGGGIDNSGTANLFNATITNNQADSDFNGTGTGGGVFNEAGGTFNFQNTIIAGNFETFFFAPLGWVSTFRDCAGAGTLTSIGNNLMRNVDNCTFKGSEPTLANPVLGPLQNNGGPTQTHAPLAGSPAIDAGDIQGCRDNLGALLQTEQRGRLRHVDGNNDGADTCDIGALEFGSGVGAPADFDGDGETDIALYRSGTWYILRSTDNGIKGVAFGGVAGDIPVPADYDGDGKTDVAVFRDGGWYIFKSSGGTHAVGWGAAGDVPIS